ncbi:MAG: hypothetical protein IKQ51_01005 [Bacteroidaceae bacterium]|nr:hypothetical protein [Bacteroidaceae bacterium]
MNDAKGAIIHGLASARRYQYNDGTSTSIDSILSGNLIVEAIVTNILGKSKTTTSKDKNGKNIVKTHYECSVEAVLSFKNYNSGTL